MTVISRAPRSLPVTPLLSHVRQTEVSSAFLAHGSLFTPHNGAPVSARGGVAVGAPAPFVRRESSERVTMAERAAKKSLMAPPVADWRGGSSADAHRGETVSNGSCSVPDAVRRAQTDASCESPTWETAGTDSALKPIPRRSSLIKVRLLPSTDVSPSSHMQNPPEVLSGCKEYDED